MAGESDTSNTLLNVINSTLARYALLFYYRGGIVRAVSLFVPQISSLWLPWRGNKKLGARKYP